MDIVRTQPSFARARTEEQRAARRAAILEVAASMLATSRVAEFSLNELARRVCLAKSNVLRYFDSREAVLRELLGLEYDAWINAIESDLAALPPRGNGSDCRQMDASSQDDRIDTVARIVARTAAARPLMCELLSSATLILEHNVSAESAAQYKRRALTRADRLVRLLAEELPINDQDSQVQLAGAVNIAIGGFWPLSRPSPGMLAAYQSHPELAAYRLDFETMLCQFLAVVMTGLIARQGGQRR
jgi:AcrR family transcriptional regulator